MPPKDSSEPRADRVFVAKHHVGSIPSGHTFSETEFKRLHPLPRDPHQAVQLGDNYHNDLIGRLLASGSIEVAPQDAEAEPVPDGPAELNRAAQASTVIEAAKETPQPNPPKSN